MEWSISNNEITWGLVLGLGCVASYNLILSQFMVFFEILYPGEEQYLGLFETGVYP